MSIQHLEAAAEAPLHATAKLVLMAIADDANKATRKAYPGLAKMQLWSGASESRVQGILQELIAEQYIARLNFAMPGKRAEWLLFPTTDEIDKIDARNPDLNRVSPDSMKRVMAANQAREERAAAEAKRAEDAEQKRAAKAAEREARRASKAPQGPEKCLPPMAPTESGMPATQDGMPATGGRPPVITSPSIPKSSEDTHLPAREVLDGDDDQHHAPTPRDVAVGQRVNLTEVQAALQALTAERVTPRDATDAAHTILVRSASPVGHPTNYVLQAIANDTFGWTSWLLERDARREQLDAETGGNPF